MATANKKIVHLPRTVTSMGGEGAELGFTLLHDADTSPVAVSVSGNFLSMCDIGGSSSDIHAGLNSSLWFEHVLSLAKWSESFRALA
jgi:hypothetical protein